jgi:hypothetical protein
MRYDTEVRKRHLAAAALVAFFVFSGQAKPPEQFQWAIQTNTRGRTSRWHGIKPARCRC